jgi:GTPase Era involved in 16S rRNA processing
LQSHLESRVYLDLHVKVKSEWRDNDRLLDEMGLQNRKR